MKIVIFTAIFGGKDSLREPLFSPSPGTRMLCYSDVPLKSKNWEIIVDEPCDPDPRRSAKVYKICPHRFLDCDVSVWIDGRAGLRTEFGNSIAAMEHDISMFAHPGDRCAYRELNNCLRLKKDKPEVMRAQMDRYRSEGFPANYGLTAAGCIIRKHVPDIEKLNETWWSEVVRGSVRDQLSFNYCAWKLGVEYDIIPGSFWDNRHYKMLRHKK